MKETQEYLLMENGSGWFIITLTRLVINGKYKHGELLGNREVISTKAEYLKGYRRKCFKMV